MPHLGDRATGSTIVFNFTTAVDGVPTTLAGSPALAAYKNSTTQATAGITLTVDYDSLTGMHHVVVDTSQDGTFYAASNDFSIVLTAGTVGGKSVAGHVVGSFSLGDSRLAHLDADISSRLASSGYTAPANSDVAAIKAVTDNLPDSGALSSLATASALSDVASDVGDILTDTGTTLPGTLSTIAGYIDTEVAAIKAKTDNLPSDPADASVITAAFSSLQSHGDSNWGTATGFATATDLATVDSNVDAIKAVTDALPDSGALSSLATASALSTVDGVVDAIKTTTDKLDDTLELDSTVYRFTTNALEQAPTGSGGGSGPSASEIADEVQTRTIARVTLVDTVTTNTDMRGTDNALLAANYTAPANSDVAAIKQQTDKLAFTVANQVDANIRSVNSTTVTGTGANGDEWGP